MHLLTPLMFVSCTHQRTGFERKTKPLQGSLRRPAPPLKKVIQAGSGFKVPVSRSSQAYTHFTDTTRHFQRQAHPYSQKSRKNTPPFRCHSRQKISEFSLRCFAAVHSRGFNFCLRVCRWTYVFVCFLTVDTFVLSSSLGIHGRESQSFGLVES